MRSAVDVPRYEAGVLAGDRTWVARAVTLVESARADHRDAAQHLLTLLLPHAGRAARVGISGVPGVGKSTFVETLGTNLTAAGHRVAVLAVDPSSSRSGGSILGDKTRMGRLAVDPAAFVRPSPNAGTLGGVTRTTREAMVVMEAAGYDVVLVETVGVGQSETAVAAMVDTFVLLALAGAGDQLQGVKRGILELVDVIAVNKSDGSRREPSRVAAAELAAAMRLMHPAREAWRPPVLTCSARENTGVDDVWARVTEHRSVQLATGELEARRRRQQVDWLWGMVRDRLLNDLHAHPEVQRLTPELQRKVVEGTCTAPDAATRLVEAFHRPMVHLLT
jgi:LAO/AO transport system kinase